jgi:antitoxin ParD1/3/4
MPTRNVNLTDHFDHFIENGISSGRFSNASEVVREGLRLLEQREQEDKAKLEWLRSAAREGFESFSRGESYSIHSAEDLNAFMEEIRREVSDESAAERKRDRKA